MALEAKPAAHDHLPEEALENYAFGRLPRAQLEAFEEHLLFCEHCQERLDAEDHFAAQMRALAALESTLPDSSLSLAASSSSWAGRVRRGCRAGWDLLQTFAGANSVDAKTGHPLVWGTSTVMILAVTLGISSWLAPHAPQIAEIVDLKTLRGGGDGIAQARPDRPVKLSIDLEGVGLGESPERGPYRLEVVDASGNQVWTGIAMAFVSNRMEMRVEKRLSSGIYWVRLYDHSGKLLREFGLHVG